MNYIVIIISLLAFYGLASLVIDIYQWIFEDILWHDMVEKWNERHGLESRFKEEKNDKT